MRAINPQTGEQLILVGGRWVPLPAGGDAPAGSDDPGLLGTFTGAFGEALGPQTAEMLGSAARGAGVLTGQEGIGESVGEGFGAFAEWARGEDQAAPWMPGGFADVAEQPLRSVAALTGAGLGSTVAPLATGIAGGLAGGAAFGPAGATVGGLAGTLGSSVALSFGENYQTFTDLGATDEDAARMAGALSLPQGAMEAIVPGRLIGPLRRAGTELLQRAGREGGEGVARRIGREALEGTATEAATEAAQTGLREFGASQVAPEWTQEGLAERVAMDALAGGLAGGVFGGVGGAVYGDRPQRQEPPPPRARDSAFRSEEADTSLPQPDEWVEDYGTQDPDDPLSTRVGWRNIRTEQTRTDDEHRAAIATPLSGFDSQVPTPDAVRARAQAQQAAQEAQQATQEAQQATQEAAQTTRRGATAFAPGDAVQAAPVAAAGPSGTIAEPPEQIAAQVRAYQAEQRGPVFVDAAPGSVAAPEGLVAFPSRFGGTYLVKPEQAAQVRAIEATTLDKETARARVLGYGQSKTEAMANGAPVAVQATDAEGNVVSEELVDATNAEAVAAASESKRQMAEEIGGLFTIVPPDQAIRARQEQVQTAAVTESAFTPGALPQDLTTRAPVRSLRPGEMGPGIAAPNQGTPAAINEQATENAGERIDTPRNEYPDTIAGINAALAANPALGQDSGFIANMREVRARKTAQEPQAQGTNLAVQEIADPKTLPPMSVVAQARDMNGNMLGYFSAPHDGTSEGKRRANDAVRADLANQFGNWSNVNTRTGITDEQGRAAEVISPNGRNISPAGSEEAAYTFGERLTPPEPAPELSAPDQAQIPVQPEPVTPPAEPVTQPAPEAQQTQASEPEVVTSAAAGVTSGPETTVADIVRANAQDRWRETQAKARKLAKALIDGGATDQATRDAFQAAWRDKDRLVAEIDKVIGEPAAEKPAAPLQLKDIDGDRFAVVGDVKPHKDRIKALGGRWNIKHKGWLFPNAERATVERELAGLLSGRGAAPAAESEAALKAKRDELRPQIQGIRESLPEDFVLRDTGKQLDLYRNGKPTKHVGFNRTVSGAEEALRQARLMVEADQPDAPYTQRYGEQGRAAADRLELLLDLNVSRNTPEGAALDAVRSVVSELRKPKTTSSVIGMLETAAQRLDRNFSDSADVIREVVESLKQPADKPRGGYPIVVIPDWDTFTPDQISDKQYNALVQFVALSWNTGEPFGSIDMDALARQLGQKKYEPATRAGKVIEEIAEAGLANRMRLVNSTETTGSSFERAVEAYESQPSFRTRTGTSSANQAYSTPAPVGYALAEVLNYWNKATLEPTAGTGLLLADRPGRGSVVNELDPLRAKLLEAQGFNPTMSNAADPELAEGKAFDVVIANPPFGTTQSEAGRRQNLVVNDPISGDPIWRGTAIDQAIALNSAMKLKPGGRLALVMGGPNPKILGDEDARQKHYKGGPALFFNVLRQHFSIDRMVTLDGKLYKKQGAGWPIDIIIATRREAPISREMASTVVPSEALPIVARSWTEMRDGLVSASGGRLDVPRSEEQPPAGGSQQGPRAQAGRPGGPGADDAGAQPGLAGSGAGAGGAGSAVAGTEQPGATGDAGVRGPGVRGVRGGGGGQQSVSAGDVAGDPGAGENAAGDVAAPADGGRAGPSDSVGGAEYGAANTFVTADRAKELRDRLKQKLKDAQSTASAGIDPEMLAIGAELAAFHIEAGARKFVDFSRAIAADLDTDIDSIRKYLRSWYNGARDMMEDSGLDVAGMDGPDVVSQQVKTVQAAPKPEPKTAPAKKKAKGAAETSLQKTYSPRSARDALDTLIPTSLAEPTQQALTDLERRVGNLDDFVMKELGYESRDETILAAEQVDSVALAIDNAKSGRGIVIGDQTGVGKGVQVASMIRWAQRNGMTPVFMTEKPALYLDMMFRDLPDVGSPGLRPFVTNSKFDGKNQLKHESGQEIRVPKDQRAVMSAVINGKPFAGYDVVMTTYDQTNTKRAEQAPRHRFLEAIAPNAFFILDESHNAGGTGATWEDVAAAAEAGKPILPRELLIRDWLTRARAAMFSSATWAKRPQTMTLYATRTDMGLAVPGAPIAEMFSRGGVPMQQAVSAMLARNGQYIRREKSFAGIDFAEKVIETSVRTVDSVAERLQGIIRWDSTVGKSVRERHRASQGGSNQGGDAQQNADGMEFTSIMATVLDQTFAALKAPAIADEALAAIQAGEKPVIAFDNTMGSMLGELVQKGAAQPGRSFDFRLVDLIQRYLDRRLGYNFTDPVTKQVSRVWIDWDFLDPAEQASFLRESNEIKKALGDVDVPGSPIDAVIARIEGAGYKVGEITGRQLRVDYNTGKMEARKGAGDPAVRAKVVADFNAGPLDAIVLNRSGATGVSMHASERVADQRKRVMILGQFEKNIDTFIQLLGRVNRTGQVVPPRYVIPSSNIPAENRMLAVLKRKLISLQANVTASGKGQVDIEKVPDFINEVGDAAAFAVLAEETPMRRTMGLELPSNPDDMNGSLITKATGRVALLPMAEQERFYDRLLDEYQAEVMRREAEGRQLGAATLQKLEAKPKQLMAYREGDGPSAFQSAVYAVEIDAKLLVKPPTWDGTEGEISRNYESLEGAKEHTRELFGNLDEAMKAALKVRRDRIDSWQEELSRAKAAKASAAADEAVAIEIDIAALEKDIKREEKELEDVRERAGEIKAAMRSFYPGASFRVDIGEEPVIGRVLALDRNRRTRSELSPSSYKLTLAFASVRPPRLEMNIGAFIRMEAEQVRANEAKEAFDLINEQTKTGREDRVVLVGNIPRAMALAPARAQITQFTDADGRAGEGVLMPPSMRSLSDAEAQALDFTSVDAALRFLEHPGAKLIVGRDEQSADLIVERDGSNLNITAPASGRRFLTNKGLRDAIAPREFVRRFRGAMSEVTVPMVDVGPKAVRSILYVGRTALRPVNNLNKAREIQGVASSDAAAMQMDQGAGLFDQLDAMNASKPKFQLGDQGQGYRLSEETSQRLPALERDLVARMQALNLADKIPLNFAKELRRQVGQVGGARMQGSSREVKANAWWLDGAISVALDAPDAMGSLNHEVIHGLKGLGLFNGMEWKALERAARADADLFNRVRSQYDGLGLTEPQIVEEVIAEQYRMWAEGQMQAGNWMRRAFDRIKRFFDALGQALRGQGFTTPNAVFRRVESGAVGRRETQGSATGSAMQKASDKLVKSAEGYRSYYKQRTWASVEKARAEITDKINRENERYAGLFPATDPAVVDLLQFVSAPGGKVKISQKGKAPKKEPIQLFEEPTGSAPDVNWTGRDLMNDGSASSAFLHYGRGKGVPAEGYISLDQVPQEKLAGGVTGYDWTELERGGAPPPATIRLNHNGSVTIMDGNHRIRFWREQGYEQIPVFVIDERANPTPKFQLAGLAPGAEFQPRESLRQTMQAIDEDTYSLIQRVARPANRGKIGHWLDKARFLFQDRMIHVRRVQDAVEQQIGRPLRESERAYLSDELLAGRVGEKKFRTQMDFQQPLLERMHEAGLTVGEIDDYLYARHAGERNDQIARINPDMPDGGSGITTAEANRHLAEIPAEKRAALEDIATLVDGMMERRLEHLVESGVLSQQAADSMRATYEHYVPLRGKKADPDEDVVELLRPHTGRGYMGSRALEKRATGRFSEAPDILATAFVLADEAIVRGEKNIVGQSILRLANLAPDPNVWTVNPAQMKAYIDKASGQVRYKQQAHYSGEDTMSVRVDGREYRVQIKDPSLLASIKQIGGSQQNAIVENVAKVTQVMSKLNTMWNPEFVVANASRDIQTALANLGIQENPNELRKFVGNPRNWANALRGMHHYLKTGRSDTEWSQYAQEFRAAGGQTAFNALTDVDSQRKSLETALSELNGGNVRTATRSLRTLRDTVERMNDSVDNAVRLGTFVALRNRGVSAKRAASVAKNLTVNFNRRGALGPTFNAFFMFFNAAVQGTAVLANAVRSPQVRKLVGAIAVAGAMQEIIGGLMPPPEDDEDGLGLNAYDRIPEWVKTRNLIVPYGPDAGDYVQIPMPYGYNFFHNLGRLSLAYLRGAPTQEGMPVSLGQTAAHLARAFQESILPPGLGDSALSGVPVPSVVAPFVETAVNEDWTGKQIMPGRFPGDDRPDSQLYFNNVNPITREVSQFLNSMTGGNAFRPGLVDVSPESIEHVISSFAGAAGAQVTRAIGSTSRAAGEALGMNEQDPNLSVLDVPFIRKVAGYDSPFLAREVTYRRITEIETLNDEIKSAKEDGNRQAVLEMRREAGPLISMKSAAAATRRELKDVRKARQRISESETMTTAQKRQRMDQLDAREEKLMRAFNQRYLVALRRKES